MEEMNKNKDSSEGYVKKQGLLEWLDNFWYHYKWHSIVALFLVFTITICSLQMCSKESYDIHVLYSGGHEISRKSVDGNTPEYKSMLSSIARVTDDFDENGEVSVTLKDLFMLSSDEIAKVEESDEYEVNYALINENKRILRDTIMYSSYYLCLLSPTVYNEYKTIDGVEIFEPLAPLVDRETVGVVYYDSCAVYLSTTGFYSLPGISSLPPDTLVCLRTPSVFASHFNKKDTERDYGRGKEAAIKMLNYKISK